MIDVYSVLYGAQAEGVAAGGAGSPAQDVDAVTRDRIEAAGYGERFMHRTGHGIGVEEHEDPYIVTGNATPLVPGMAFSIEPGFYFEGRFGARIEDIVVCDETGAIRLNTVSRDLCVI